jgi:hypothetical protein
MLIGGRPLLPVDARLWRTPSRCHARPLLISDSFLQHGGDARTAASYLARTHVRPATIVAVLRRLALRLSTFMAASACAITSATTGVSMPVASLVGVEASVHALL